MSACYFWWQHEWPKWRDIHQVTTHPLYSSDADSVISSFIVQERRCGRCGRLEMRRVYK